GIGHAQFAGDYAPPNWTISHTPNDFGSVNTIGAPSSISMTSSNSEDGNFLTTSVYFTITIPITGNVNFTWNYNTSDDAGYDYPEYSINGGLPVLLPGYNNNSGAPTTQSGTATIPVTAGQSFAFVMTSFDNTFGAATVTIS